MDQESIDLEYRPHDRTLSLSFEMVFSNNGNKTGIVRSHSARIYDEKQPGFFIPFANSDITFNTGGSATADSFYVDKDGGVTKVRCVMNYRIGLIGERTLGQAGTKVLRLKFAGDSRDSMVAQFVWDPAILRARKPAPARLPMMLLN